MTSPSATSADYLSTRVAHPEFGPSAVALVIIDMQYATGSRHHGLGRQLQERGDQDSFGWRYEQIEQRAVPNLQRLLQVFRASGRLVVHVTIGSERDDFSDALPQIQPMLRSLDNRVGQPMNRILEPLTPAPGEPVLNKVTIGAFASTPIERVLREHGVERIVMGGISTNACVAATACAAVDLGFQTVLLSDGCSAATREYHEAALASFGRLFGRVMSTDDVLGVVERG